MSSRKATKHGFRRVIESFLTGFNRPHSSDIPTRGPAFLRKPRLEPLEDRRMLSLTLFVNDDSVGGDGLSWETAYADLQTAFEQAATLNTDADTTNDVDAIWVADGTYYPSAELEEGDPRSASFSLVDGVGLYGGFAGTEATLEERAADPAEHETILSGDIGVAGDDADNAYTVVYCGEGVTAEIDGVTVTGGRADGSDTLHRERGLGGGIFNAGDLTLRRSMIAQNEASGGGGISNSASLAVIDCVLGENGATYGGGVYSRPGVLSVMGSTLANNWGRFDGGAIYARTGELSIGNCTIWDNASDDGGGIYQEEGSLHVFNSTVWGNLASRGGGIYSDKGDLLLSNCTIAHNGALKGGGVYHYTFWGDVSIVINNTILAANCSTCGNDFNNSGRGYVYSNHSLFGSLSNSDSIVHGENGTLIGTLDNPIDPLLSDWSLLDEGSWGYYLLLDSPALNAGDNDLAVDFLQQAIDTDLYGNQRIQDGTVDMGSREGASSGTPAQTYVVTSLLDVVESGDGMLTFAEALQAAQRNEAAGDAPAGSFSEQDIIEFASGLNGTVTLNGEEITIHGDLQLRGPGAGQLQFAAMEQSRVFRIQPGVSAALSGLSINGGNVTSDKGTGLASLGGGLLNCGLLTVSDCVVSDSTASGGGGGIANFSALTMTGSAILANTADTKGGGIHNLDELALTNCTICGNKITDQNDYGGGLYSSTESPVRIDNTIIAGNCRAGSDAADVRFWHPYDSISGSNNLIGNGGVQNVFADGIDGNLVGTAENPIDPLLSHYTILDNGLWGFRLLPDSPAINAGSNTLAVDAAGQPIMLDINGDNRIRDGVVDIGCIEGASEPAPGQVYTVTSLADAIDPADGELTFIEAFEAAGRNVAVGDAAAGSFAEEDVIRFADGLTGTVSLAGRTWEVPGDLRIEGPESGHIALDGGGQGRVFDIALGARFFAEGVTITGGGLINCGEAIFVDTLFTDNEADYGGAIENFGTLTIRDSRFVENTAAYDGGAVWNAGFMEVSHANFVQNTASRCGGAIANRARAEIRTSAIESNIAYDNGGGVYNQYGDLSVIETRIEQNSADDGGGIFVSSGHLSITSSVISANEATYGAGGIQNAGTTRILNSLISSNSASMKAGGIENTRLLTLINVTVTANRTESGSGGLRSSGSYSTLTLQGSIIAGNATPDPEGRSDISFSETQSFAISNSIIGDGTGQNALVDCQDGNRVGTAENSIDARFFRVPSPGPDDVWGNEDDDPGDLRLASDSPARDAGDKSLLPPDEFDLDGDGDTTEPLPIDLAGDPRVDNGRLDAGAYEYQSGNLIPLPVDETYFTDEDTPLIVDGIELPTVLENDADPEDAPLTAVWVSDPAHGVLELNADGTFTYEPDADWHGGDWFTYMAYDGTGYSEPATVFVIVRSVNDRPVLDPVGDFVLDEETTLSFSVDATDLRDPIPNPVVLSISGLPEGAVFDPEAGEFSWTPTEAQDGVHTMTVIATDGNDPDVFSSETITVTVNEVNRPPYFEIEGSGAIDWGTPWTMRVQVLDPDLPSNPISVEVEGLPEGASYDPLTGILSWTATLEDSGEYVLSFRADDNGTPNYTIAQDVSLAVRKGPMLHVDADAEPGGNGLDVGHGVPGYPSRPGRRYGNQCGLDCGERYRSGLDRRGDLPPHGRIGARTTPNGRLLARRRHHALRRIRRE